MNNIKNNWKGIKSILTINNTSSDFPKCLSSNGSMNMSFSTGVFTGVCPLI